MPDIVLETQRLMLRRTREGDAEAWMTHLNSAKSTAHLGGPRTLEQIQEKLGKMARSWDDHGYSFLFVETREGGLFLGTCGIAPIANTEAPEELQGAIQIGWHLREDYWGYGYAHEAARAVMGFAFEQPGVSTVYSQTARANEPSWRLMEKLGMTRRPDLDYHDPAYSAEENPTIIYAIDTRSWRNVATRNLAETRLG